MLKDKKGFTLVELIGVIAVIAIIGVIVVSIIINSLSGTKKDLASVQEKQIVSMAKVYFNENLGLYTIGTTPDNCEDTVNGTTTVRKCNITSDYLVSIKYIDQPIDSQTKTNVSYDIFITFTLENGKAKDIEYLIKLYDIPLNENNKPIPTFTDNSGANKPVLVYGMIPVVYDTTNNTWVKASERHGYYAYQDQIWANAVTVTSTNRDKYINAEPGTKIPMDDINAIWVWIPRFKYKITSSIGIGTKDNLITNPPQIDVVFENGINATGVAESVYRTGITTDGTNTNYYTHPSFRNGTKVYKTNAYDIGGWDEELTGFWVGKFETGGTADIPLIKPEIKALSNQNVSTQFITSLKFSGGTMNTTSGEVTFSGNDIYGLNSSTNSHMMKNTEWGAVAILSQSQYGKMGNSDYEGENKEIYNNNRGITGRSGGSPNANGVGTVTSHAYNHPELGKGASTTGTIYGIYDMNGGNYEYTMANNAGYAGASLSYNSGFNGPMNSDGTYETGISFPTEKYYDKYISLSYEVALKKDVAILGDATWETAFWYYNNYPWGLSPTRPWPTRGGTTNGNFSIYSMANFMGEGSGNFTFRTVLMP